MSSEQNQTSLVEQVSTMASSAAGYMRIPVLFSSVGVLAGKSICGGIFTRLIGNCCPTKLALVFQAKVCYRSILCQ